MKVVGVLFLLIANAAGLLCGPPSSLFSNTHSQSKQDLLRDDSLQKIDSQLLFAIRQMQGRTTEAPVEEIKLRRDRKNRVLVDVRAAVTKRILATLKHHGARIVSTSSRDDSIITYIALDKVEALAKLKDIKFIMPAAEAVTN
jgi:hypothetical protein